ncbi:MAG: DNA-3-methyladenine glycosylase, partial [Microbacteriaceae bacterium]|nr:DNA-3-methyladenine glycosylase [Microbacteriaceae bacterium]
MTTAETIGSNPEPGSTLSGVAGDSATATRVRPHILVGDDGVSRCAWVGRDAEYLRYHDEEWGREQRDSRALFEKLCLEGFQAGLSWITILRRRPAFREVFFDFEVERVATMSEPDVQRLLQDERIIRHRGKIEATIGNARATRELGESLADLMWRFAPDAAGRPRPASYADMPAVTPESTAMSVELRKRGFRFVGPT